MKMLTSTSLANITEFSLSRSSCHLHSGFSYDRNFCLLGFFKNKKFWNKFFFAVSLMEKSFIFIDYGKKDYMFILYKFNFCNLYASI